MILYHSEHPKTLKETTVDETILKYTLMCTWYLAGLWAAWKTWQATRKDGIKLKTSLWIALFVSFFGIIAAIGTYFLHQQDANNPKRHP